jgi:hypothetical protein
MAAGLQHSTLGDCHEEDTQEQMKRLAEVVGPELLWTRPSARRKYDELRSGDETVATLQWKKGSLAVAEVADARWTIKRQGFWQQGVKIRREGSDVDIARFDLGWLGGGTLDPGSGRRFRWGSANFWRSSWQWTAEDGTPLVRFAGKQRWTKMEGEVEVEPAAADLPELPLLVTLGWYLLVMTANEEAAGAVIVTTSA